MKYITLLCSMGMSTSLLVNKMKDAAKQSGEEVTIKAMAKDSLRTRCNSIRTSDTSYV